MCKAIDDIRQIVVENDLQLSWLAQQLGGKWNKHRLYYLLHSGKDVSVTDYWELMRFFDRHGFVSSPCAGATALDEVAKLNSESAKLVKLAVESFRDNTLSEDERNDLLLKVAAIERRAADLRELLG